MEKQLNNGIIGWMEEHECLDAFRAEMKKYYTEEDYLKIDNYYNKYFGGRDTFAEAFEWERSIKGRAYWDDISYQFIQWWKKQVTQLNIEI